MLRNFALCEVSYLDRKGQSGCLIYILFYLWCWCRGRLKRLELELLHSGGDRAKEIRVGMLVIVHYEDVRKVR